MDLVSKLLTATTAVSNHGRKHSIALHLNVAIQNYTRRNVALTELCKQENMSSTEAVIPDVDTDAGADADDDDDDDDDTANAASGGNNISEVAAAAGPVITPVAAADESVCPEDSVISSDLVQTSVNDDRPLTIDTSQSVAEETQLDSDTEATQQLSGTVNLYKIFS